ncbi:hypothetical protein [Thermomonospora cellulosilytica]|uniref:Uncharacterized protein n=1 Tax=Thermomonospora cellulosilytica TaxID=1411118 RepID=A0A7W3MX99_9ACTN|nr:hypothetical protein [Thermomonospora cellulosilytica]MBA9003502.1 hypothetical protein [Thermomonospora cellulosilytica]
MTGLPSAHRAGPGRPWQVAVAVPVIAVNWLILALAYVRVNHTGDGEPNHVFLTCVGMLTLLVWFAGWRTWQGRARAHVALLAASLLVGGIPLVAMLTVVPMVLLEGDPIDSFLVKVAVWAATLVGAGLLLMRPAVQQWIKESDPAARSTPDDATGESRQ